MRIISGTARGTKLKTLDGIITRPTLDRVKESLFSIIGSLIPDSEVLDLFSGSGALGIESLSRGAKFCVFCDNLDDAIYIIKENIKKTNFEHKSMVVNNKYEECLKQVKNKQFDIIFIDPPYDNSEKGINAIEKILELNLLKEKGIVVLETDDEEKQLSNIKEKMNVYDIRKYGRVKLIFINRKG